MDHPRRGKVFGVGFHRTGTTTLDRCLKTLGFDAWWFERSSNPQLTAILDGLDRGDLGPTLDIVARHEAFTDNPFFFPGVHRELARRFPDARFILTRRPAEAWLASCQRYFVGKRHTHRTFPMIYGAAHPSACPAWVETYERHNAAVIDALGDRVVVLDWSRGDGWPELCGFLGCPVPDAPLPHLNQSRRSGA